MAATAGLSAAIAEGVLKTSWKKESQLNKVRIKKSGPKAKADDPSQTNPNLVVNTLEPELRLTFENGRPWDDRLNPLQCKHCKKPLLSMYANEHLTVCIQKKNEKAQRKKEQKEANRKAREAQQKAERAGEELTLDAEGDDDDDGDGKTGKKSAIKTGVPGAAKKRKAEDEQGGMAKKKTKKELEAMKPKVKPRGPVDVEKQCGVLLPNGQMCARSLTCKSHSMGAKRSVPGRSLPYNVLLAAYNKKNQAKQQKAALDANAPMVDDYNDNAGPVDSDEEKDLVMAGIARSRPQPVAQHCPISMRRKYQFIRVKDLIRSALGTGKGGFGAGAAAAVLDNTGDEVDAVPPRQSFSQAGAARPSLSGMGAGPSRKTSLVTPGTAIIAN